MARVERMVKFTGAKPSRALKQFYIEKVEIINAFIFRCYENTTKNMFNVKTYKTKLNKANHFKEWFGYYNEKMYPQNRELVQDLYEKLLQSVQPIEKPEFKMSIEQISAERKQLYEEINKIDSIMFTVTDKKEINKLHATTLKIQSRLLKLNELETAVQ